jgi:hypothetical protein
MELRYQKEHSTTTSILVCYTRTCRNLGISPLRNKYISGGLLEANSEYRFMNWRESVGCIQDAEVYHHDNPSIKFHEAVRTNLFCQDSSKPTESKYFVTEPYLSRSFSRVVIMACGGALERTAAAISSFKGFSFASPKDCTHLDFVKSSTISSSFIPSETGKALQ